MSAAGEKRDLFDLMCSHVDGTLDDDQLQQLETALQDNENARREYLDFMSVESGLAAFFGTKSASAQANPAPSFVFSPNADASNPDPLIDTYEESETGWFDPTDRSANAARRNPDLSSPLHYGEKARLHPGETVKQDAKQRKS